ncbi:MAG: hypothetical protein D6731_06130 [Planctomycetota bacterium]|nr:MAG: hypothetical protein D6731_06130 [Planctomycetota bacterium]
MTRVVLISALAFLGSVVLALSAGVRASTAVLRGLLAASFTALTAAALAAVWRVHGAEEDPRPGAAAEGASE